MILDELKLSWKAKESLAGCPLCTGAAGACQHSGVDHYAFEAGPAVQIERYVFC
ncbi:hypothetical protein ACIFQM_16410 [Paenibacillus sp. NRS-1782]|uniref:hypothetical protein n=1 Tax=unclassified Paenibacillus TaxID=185978 RepID=UPI003D2C4598